MGHQERWWLKQGSKGKTLCFSVGPILFQPPPKTEAWYSRTNLNIKPPASRKCVIRVPKLPKYLESHKPLPAKDLRSIPTFILKIQRECQWILPIVYGIRCRDGHGN
jgi:hypothetical protein